jgi:hypothetical protein
MSSTKPFPFPSGTAPESQVVEWLAELLYPKEYRKGGYDRSKAKNRVRCRISYARNVTKDHRLRRLENGHINVSQFFNWAVLQKKWEALIKVDGLRADTTVDLSEGEPIPGVVAKVGGGDAYDVPDDLNELKARYRAERLARLKAEARVEELEAENKQLKDQLLSKAERSRRASEYGEDGGRGKEK